LFSDFTVIFYLRYTRIVRIIAPPPSPKKISLFSRGGVIIRNLHEFSLFFDSRHFQMSSSDLKLYFITYYRLLVYFEVFSIYLSVFHEFMWCPKKAKKKILGDFVDFNRFFRFFEFFFSCFREGGNYSWGQLFEQFGYFHVNCHFHWSLGSYMSFREFAFLLIIFFYVPFNFWYNVVSTWVREATCTTMTVNLFMCLFN